MQVICGRCGAGNLATNPYCGHCGATLGESALPVGQPPEGLPGPPAGPPVQYSPPPGTGWSAPPPANSPYVPANFSWISQAWSLMSADLGAYVLYYFLMYLLVFVALMLPTLPFVPALIALDREAWLGSALFIMLAAVLFILLLFLQPVIVLGMSSAELRRQRFGDPLQVGASLRDGFARLGQGILFMILMTLVTSLISCANAILPCFAPLAAVLFYYLVTPIHLGYMRLVDGAPDALSALTDGFAVANRDVIGYLLFGLVVGLLASLGLLFCGIGILVTAPLSYVAYVLAYRANFERPPSG